MYCIYLRNNSIYSILYDVVYCFFSTAHLAPVSLIIFTQGRFSLQFFKRRAEHRAFWWPQKRRNKKTGPWSAGGFFGGEMCLQYLICFVFCVKPMLSSKQERKNSKFSTCIVTVDVYVQKLVLTKNAKSSTYKAVVCNYSWRCSELSRAM